MKKTVLAALVALALLCGGSAAVAPQAVAAWSWGSSQASGPDQPEVEQVAGSKGAETFGRESS